MRMFICSSLLFFFTCHAVQAVPLRKITTQYGAHQTEVSLHVGSRVSYRYFTLDTPHRLVIDIQEGVCTTPLPVAYKDPHSIVQLIRTSRSLGVKNLRLVFVLRRAACIHVQQRCHGSGYRLVFHLTTQKQKQTSAVNGTDSVRVAQFPRIQSSHALQHRLIHNRKRTILVAIDAGHGGRDPGAIGLHGLQEKKVTLAVAQRLAKLMRQEKRFIPLLIRNRDVFISIEQRAEIARQQQADLLLSIHADSASNRKARGASIWLLSAQRANNEVARWLTEKYPSAHYKKHDLLPATRDLYLNRTLLDLHFGYSMRVGHAVATAILQELKCIIPLHKTQPQYASLGVLQAPDVPSLLIETGFITHRIEGSLLNRPRYQQHIAEAIYRGLKQYFKEMQKPSLQLTTCQNSHKKRTRGRHKISPPAPVFLPVLKTYVVQPGDSLAKIAQRFQTNSHILQQFNQLKDSKIQVGQKLQLPLSNTLEKR